MDKEDDKASEKQPRRKSTNRKPLLNGQFTFKDDDNVVCVHCNGEFKYHRSTSTLSYHLRTKHAFVSLPSSSSGTNVTQSAARQPSVSDMFERARPMEQARYDSITNAIAKWIAMNGRPTNIVTDDGLQTVLRVASGNHAYKLPSRTTIDQRVTEMYKNVEIRVKAMLSDATYVALTADYWTSLANDSYLGVTSHAISSNWELQSVALAVKVIEDRHYTSACAEHFSSVATEWEIFDKVTTFSTDNARNVTAAVGLLPFQHMPCMAHTLQLSVNKAIAESGLDTVLSKCRKIVGHFKHSPANQTELKVQQSQKNTTQEVLIQDVPTRWNSTLQMIERLLRNKEPVIATLAAPSHKHSLNLLTEAEWEKLRTLKMLLEPCRYATVVLGGEKYVSCSVVLPIVTYLRRFMVVSDDDPAFAVRFKTAFTNDLDARLGNCNVSWLKLSTALDPRFKRLKCVPKAERGAVWTELQSLIAAVDSHTGDESSSEPAQKRRLYEFSSDSEDDTSEQQSQATLAVFRYQSESEIDEQACPLEWWKSHAGAYPTIVALARKYLTTPATTVPCERLFSVSGNIVSKKRASLSPGNVNKLVCLNNWLRD